MACYKIMSILSLWWLDDCNASTDLKMEKDFQTLYLLNSPFWYKALSQRGRLRSRAMLYNPECIQQCTWARDCKKQHPRWRATVRRNLWDSTECCWNNNKKVTVSWLGLKRCIFYLTFSDVVFILETTEDLEKKPKRPPLVSTLLHCKS